MNFSSIFGSNFPSEAIPVGSKKDIDDTVMALISQYYTYIDNKDVASAYKLYENNKTLLEPYMANAAYFNRLEEDIYNTGLLALQSVTTIISATEPTTQAIYGHWLKEW